MIAIIRESDVVSDPLQYNAFPGICRSANGDVLIVYRNAPRRPHITHLDPSSRCLLVRSRDGGKTFDTDLPVTVFSASGMQDPSIAVLKDGRLLANAFRWKIVPIGAESSGSEETAGERSCQWLDGMGGWFIFGGEPR